MEGEELTRLLEGLTAEDVIASEGFTRALTDIINVEKRIASACRRSALVSEVAGGKGIYRKLVRDGELNAVTMTEAFREIIAKRSRRPFGERDFIRFLCMRAYGIALREIVEQKKIEKDERNKTD